MHWHLLLEDPGTIPARGEKFSGSDPIRDDVYTLHLPSDQDLKW